MNLIKKRLIGFGAMVALVLLMSLEGLVEVRDLNVDLDRAAKVTARKPFLAGECLPPLRAPGFASRIF